MFYISAFFFTLIFSAACLAEIISLRSRQVVADRQKSQNDYRFLPPISSTANNAPNDDLELLDIVLMASVDGKFHALDRTSGTTLWSMAPTVSVTTDNAGSSSFAPLVRSDHPKIDPDLDDDDSINHELYIIEPQSGDIFVMSSPDSPLHRLPFSMSQLVDMSPFSFSGDEDRRVFVGKKETSLVLLELETGRVKATLNSECPWNPFEDLRASPVDELDLDELDGTKPPKQTSTPSEVFIGRTDYHVSIHTRPRDAFSPRPPVQNLTFSTYGPNNQDNVLQSNYQRTADNAYIQSMPNGNVISFKAQGDGGHETVTMKDSKLLWAQTFNNPIVAVFDVVKPAGRKQPIVLLQPRPRLQDVLPNIAYSGEMSSLPNLDAAYVGIVEETGSLFAMSPDRFPLVVFGDHSESVRPGGRYIDPSPGSMDGGELDIPLDVDQLTEARRRRNLCYQGSTEHQCLTGVRPLEASSRSSRLSRLLDGAPTVPLQNNTVLDVSPNVNGDPIPSTIQTAMENASTELPSRPGPPPVNEPSRLPPPFSSAPLGVLAGGAGPENVIQAVMSVGVAMALGAAWWWVAKKPKGLKLVYDSPGTAAVKDIPQITLPPDIAAVSTEVKSKSEGEAGVDSDTPGPQLVTNGGVAQPGAEESPTSDSGTAPPETPGVASGEGADVEDSDAGDKNATPAKRKGRRGARGGKGKKKKNAQMEDGEEEKEKGAVGGVSGSSDAEVRNVNPPSGLVINAPPSPASGPSLVVSDTILGFGSHGTVVFKGSLQGRAVAVKRLLQDFVTLASREVSILQDSDDHPHVIRYYYQEAHLNFLYIALELCPASLADVIENPGNFRDISVSFDPKRALRQITLGLRHLHALKLVHRDIKPQNILISGPKGGTGKSSGHRMLISDFGLCKRLDMDQTSFLPTAHGAMGAGTVGWRAPEILRGEVRLEDWASDEASLSSRGSVATTTGSSSGSSLKPMRLTKSVDIFALGCLFFYVLTNGGHPFGDRFEREINIMKNAKNLDGLERFGEEGVEAVDLITQMLDPTPSERPDTTTILVHPFFWDSARRLNFLQDASDRFEIMCRDPRDANLITLETGAFEIVGHDWHSRLDRIFIDNLGKFRKYDGRSLQDLMRALRNKKHHYQDLPDNVKRHLGPLPDGFLAYFTRRFPKLFMHVHGVIGTTHLRTESMFRSYFELAE